MSIFFDLVVIALFALCIFLGYKRGLVNVILKIFSFILALIISLILFRPISNFVIDNTNFHSDIKNNIIEFINKDDNEDISANSDNNTSVIEKYINSSIQNAAKSATENVVEVAADSIARSIISIAVFIILFIILRIIFIFIKFLSDAVTDLPIIKQFNKSGGIVYGILEALFITYIIFAIIALVGKGSSLEQGIINSYIASLFYNNNLIFILFLK